MKVTAITKHWIVTPLFSNDKGEWLLLHEMPKSQYTDEELEHGKTENMNETYPLPEYMHGKIEVGYEDYVNFQENDRYYQLNIMITAPTPEECNKEMKKFLEGDNRFKENYIRAIDWGVSAIITDEGVITENDIDWQDFTIEAYPSINKMKGFKIHGKPAPYADYNAEYNLTITLKDIADSQYGLLGFDYCQRDSSLMSSFIKEMLKDREYESSNEDDWDEWTQFRTDMEMIVWYALARQLTGFDFEGTSLGYETETEDDESAEEAINYKSKSETWEEHMNTTPAGELVNEMIEEMKKQGLPLNPRQGSVYKIKIRDKDDIARLVLNFLNCNLIKHRELSVFNTKEKPKYLPGYYFPCNAFAASYDTKNIPDREKLKKVLEENDYAIYAVASFDKEDKKRIIIQKFETVDKYLALSVHFLDYDENKILKIIKYIEEYNPLDPM